MPRIFFYIFSGVTLILGLSGCGNGGGPLTGIPISSGVDSGDGSGSGGGGDGDGDGDSGSGSGSGGDSVEPPFVSAFNVFEAAAAMEYEANILPDIAFVVDADEVGGITQIANLPASGDLTYQGYLFLFVGNGAAAAQINGDATLTVRTFERTISGFSDNFTGYTPDKNNDMQLVDYDGAPVTISAGTLTENGSGEAVVSLDIDGLLNNGVNSFVIDGTLEGNIFGASGEGLHAYGTSRTSGAGDMNSTIDGQPALFDSATLSTLRQ